MIIDGLRVIIEDPSAFCIEVTADGVLIKRWEIADPEPGPEPVLVAEPEPAQTGPVPPIQGRPEEVLNMALDGIDPVTLCREFQISPVTLRATLCGYSCYKRYGGTEKIWKAYYAQHKLALNKLSRNGQGKQVPAAA